MSNEDAGKPHAITGEYLAHMMYECFLHRVTAIGGDANKVAYQRQGTQQNFSYGMSTFRFWLGRMELAVDTYLKEKIQGPVRDTSVRTFHSASSLGLQSLRDALEGKKEVDYDTRMKTINVGDCCTLTFLEFGFSTCKDEQKDNFYNPDLSQNVEYR